MTAFHPESTARHIKHLQWLPEEFRATYDPQVTEVERQEAALELLRGRSVACAVQRSSAAAFQPESRHTPR